MTDDSTRPALKPVPIKSTWGYCIQDHGPHSKQLTAWHIAAAWAIQRSWEQHGSPRKRVKTRSMATLAKSAGMSVRKMKYIAKDLVEQGWLIRTEGQGRAPYRYHASFPVWLLLPRDRGGLGTIKLVRGTGSETYNLGIYNYYGNTTKTAVIPLERLVYPTCNPYVGEERRLNPQWDFRYPEWRSLESSTEAWVWPIEDLPVWTKAEGPKTISRSGAHTCTTTGDVVCTTTNPCGARQVPTKGRSGAPRAPKVESQVQVPGGNRSNPSLLRSSGLDKTARSLRSRGRCHEKARQGQVPPSQNPPQRKVVRIKNPALARTTPENFNAEEKDGARATPRRREGATDLTQDIDNRLDRYKARREP